MSETGKLPCGCEWDTTWGYGVANLHDYTRRCPIHARPNKAKVRASTQVITIWEGTDPVKASKVMGAYTGPWCPDCGKKGLKCKNRETCRRRGIVQNPGPKYVSVPHPSDEWMASRGYGRITTAYHSGGRSKQGGRPKLVHYLSPAQLKDAIQHYAYELDMGRAGVKEAVAA